MNKKILFLQKKGNKETLFLQKIGKKYLTFCLLLVIVFIGGFLRMYSLEKSHPSLNWDEASWGYNAYSVMQSGKDEYNKPFPIFTRAFDEYKSTVPLYLMIPSIKIFGLNEVGVRFPSAFIGTLLIIVVFLITRYYFGKIPALFASLFFAIEPWSVHLSRVYMDAIMALFFMLSGLLLFEYSKKKNWLFPLSFLSIIISIYTYNANKIVAPLLIFLLLFLNWKFVKGLNKKYLISAILISAVLLLIFGYLGLKGEAFARVKYTSILSLWPSEGKSLSGSHDLPGLFDFIVHNPYFYFFWDVAGRYLGYFSPMNLFVRESTDSALVLSGNSIFHLFEFFLWVVGLVWLFYNFKNKKEIFFLMLLAPIPAIATWSWFHPGRVMTLLAIYSILIGVGAAFVYEKLSMLSKKYLKKSYYSFVFILIIIGISTSSVFYLYDSIFVYLPLKDSGNWQPGIRETSYAIKDLYDNYDQVIIESSHANAYIFFLLYMNYPPQRYLNELDYSKLTSPRKHYDFGKFKFRNIYWPEDKYLKRTLLVGSEAALKEEYISKQPNSKILKDIKDSKGNFIARLVEIN